MDTNPAGRKGRQPVRIPKARCLAIFAVFLGIAFLNANTVRAHGVALNDLEENTEAQTVDHNEPSQLLKRSSPEKSKRKNPVTEEEMAKILEPTERIVGGTAQLKRVPWHAQVVVRYFRPDGSSTMDLCGGTLVSPEWGMAYASKFGIKTS